MSNNRTVWCGCRLSAEQSENTEWDTENYVSWVADSLWYVCMYLQDANKKYSSFNILDFELGHMLCLVFLKIKRHYFDMHEHVPWRGSENNAPWSGGIFCPPCYLGSQKR